MNAPNKGAMALKNRKESDQSSLQAEHASLREPVNLIEAALPAAKNSAKALAF